jgi:hypothetical protein
VRGGVDAVRAPVRYEYPITALSNPAPKPYSLPSPRSKAAAS